MAMQPFDDLVRGRRSIRRFTTREVEAEKLQQLLEAARWAPSWGNSQCWRFIVIKEQGSKEKLSQLLTRKNPATHAVRDAPLVLAVCGRSNISGFYNGQQVTRYGDWLLFDLGLATQNICLTAHNLGLGSVIVGAFDHAAAEEELHLPKGYEIVALIPLGYPDHSPSAPQRKACAELVFDEKSAAEKLP